VILYSRGKGKELKDAEQGCIADTLTKGCNDTIYQKLGGQFTAEEAYGATINVRGFDVQKGRVLTMLYRWEKQGIVQRIEKGVYKKTYRLTV